jgi:hypothetical protein
MASLIIQIFFERFNEIYFCRMPVGPGDVEGGVPQLAGDFMRVLVDTIERIFPLITRSVRL